MAAAGNRTSSSGLSSGSSAEAAAAAAGSLKGGAGAGSVAGSDGRLLREAGGSGCQEQRSDWRQKQLRKVRSVELDRLPKVPPFFASASSSSSPEPPETLLFRYLPVPRSSPAASPRRCAEFLEPLPAGSLAGTDPFVERRMEPSPSAR